MTMGPTADIITGCAAAIAGAAPVSAAENWVFLVTIVAASMGRNATGCVFNFAGGSTI
jgi:hypothetical protein